MSVAIQSRQPIQGYELQERVGSGGFGAVYRAYQSTLGREVAVKVIPPTYSNHPEFIRLFEREAQLVSRLEHLHIVPIHDFWRDSEGAYIVMRWMRGGNLAEALHKSPFNLQSASQLLDQIASGLAAAHHQQINHRDLKPSNILLDEEGNAYLSDFRIAIDKEQYPMLRGNPFGSFGYLAPEQVLGQEATPQSDIYSLGITLYEVLTGQSPFISQYSVDILYKQNEASLSGIKDLEEEVLEDVNQVIQKATANNPKLRYQDAIAMAAAFRQAVGINNNAHAVEIIESLTLREHEILHLLIEGYTNRQIAQELFVELPTIKWHISNIYKKLNVRSRVQAIVRTRELNLIVSSSDIEPRGRESSTSNITLPEPVNPYKGLRSFEPADNHEFFGREVVIDYLLGELASASAGQGSEDKNKTAGRFLAIVGASGSGKSSLIKAGLIPALWSGRLPGSDKWFVINMVPGSRPLENLETSLSRIKANQANSLRQHLDRDSLGLSRIANLILPSDDSELVVIIDQFEQLFTLVKDESIRSQFLALLEQAVKDIHSRVRVIITLRADYYDRPLRYSNFGRMIKNHLETLLPLSVEEMERAIVQPARQVEVELERGLVPRIIEDINNQPGNLPLLQYALTELFDQRDDRLLTHQVFELIGGVSGALVSRAEQLYLEQDDQGQEIIRQMFLRLVAVGESQIEEKAELHLTPYTSRRVLLSELLSAADDPDLLEDNIETYVNYRLLTLDHDPASRKPTIELAHEAIIEAWDRLHQWLEQSASDIRMQQQLIRAASEWEKAGRDDSFLLRGARLASFESWARKTQLNFTDEEKAYLSSSISAREARAAFERERQEKQVTLEQQSKRRLKFIIGILAVALLITSGLTTMAISFARQAEAEQRFAEQQQRLGFARELSAAAFSNLETNPERSILLALKAAETTQKEDGFILPEVERILHLAVQADRTEITIPMVGFVAFSHDGRILAIGDSNGLLKLWETSTGKEIEELEGHESLISDITFSHDDQFLISSSFDQRIIIWDVANGSQISTIEEFESQVNGIDLSPDGKWLATANQNGPVQIWDISPFMEQIDEGANSPPGAKSILSFQPPQETNDVEFSPDGKRLAVFMPTEGIVIWDVETGDQLLDVSSARGISTNISFSPNGEYLASGSTNLGTSIWNAANGEQEMFLPETAPITTVAFSQDGKKLATSSKNGMVSLWDIDTQSQSIKILGQPTGFNFLALNSEGDQIAVGNSPKSTSLWDVSAIGSREVLTIAAHEGKVHDAIYNPTGTKIASTGEDGYLRIWDSTTGTLLYSLPALKEWVNFPVFSPDGERVAAANRVGGVSIWDADSGLEITSIANEGPAITAITFSPDGLRIAAGGLGGIVHIWNVATGQELSTINNHEGLIITDLIFSEDGSLIYTYDWQGWTRSWESDTGEQLSGDGPNLSCEATLWDAEASSDGSLQAVAAFDGAAYVLLITNLSGNEPNFLNVLSLTGHEGNVTGVSINGEGTRLATSGFDGTVRLWKLDIGEEVREMSSGEEISLLTDQPVPLGGIDFSPDGRSVVTAGDDGMVRVFTVAVEDLIDLARFRLSRGFSEEECQTYLHKPACEED